MGYRQYLESGTDHHQPGFWQDLGLGLRGALRRFVDTRRARTGQGLPRPLTHDEALSALFPEKITAFFAERDSRLLLYERVTSDREAETLEAILMDSLDEDPVLFETAKQVLLEWRTAQTASEQSESPPKPESGPAAWMKGSVDEIICPEIPRVETGSVRKSGLGVCTTTPGDGPAVGRLGLLGTARIEDTDDWTRVGRPRLLLENSRFLSKSINHLANRYFEACDSVDREFPSRDR